MVNLAYATFEHNMFRNWFFEFRMFSLHHNTERWHEHKQLHFMYSSCLSLLTAAHVLTQPGQYAQSYQLTGAVHEVLKCYCRYASVGTSHVLKARVLLSNQER